MTKSKIQLFLVNKLATNLSLKNGYLTVPSKGFSKITEFDTTEASVVYAIGRDWAEIVDKEPGLSVAKPEVEISQDTPYRGMTLEELKEDNAKSVAKPAATSSASGCWRRC